MHRLAISVILFCGLLFIPHFIFASVVINEILFDPAGTDTGLEKIELYNPDAESADMSNFELYPDGIGYFVFPAGFSLASKSFLTLHLRLAGGDDVQNLYHSSAASNMGNSSGSVAIFRPGGRSQDTIVDFIRYHRPGASERKTWESAAVEAGLWTSGEFVDIAALSEGSSIGFVTDGLGNNAASWKIFQTPTIGSSNGSLSAPPTSQAATTTPSSPQPLPAPRPSLGADAGPDALALAGAVVTFIGTAYGLDGQPLPSARFLWNFGDGTIKEGRSLIHIYRFPGSYRASLTVSSGEYSGSDWRSVSVIPADVKISEIKPGQDGFVELYNFSPEEIDLGGLNLTDDKKNHFSIPSGTVIGGQSPLVLANALTGLRPAAALILRDAAMSQLDAAEFGYPPPPGASYERSGRTFILKNPPTPGKFSAAGIQASKPSPPPAPSTMPVSPSAAAQTLSSPAAEVLLPTTAPALPSAAPIMEGQPAAEGPSAAEGQTRTLAGLFGANIFLAVSLGLGLAAVMAFLAVKRMLP